MLRRSRGTRLGRGLVRAVTILERRARRLQRELDDTFEWEEEEVMFLIKLLDAELDQPWSPEEEKLAGSIRKKLLE
jgi:hypothetical protein